MMENLIEKSLKKSLIKPIIFLILFLGIQHIGYSSNLIETDTIGFNRYKGKVIDSKTKNL